MAIYELQLHDRGGVQWAERDSTKNEELHVDVLIELQLEVQ